MSSSISRRGYLLVVFSIFISSYLFSFSARADEDWRIEVRTKVHGQRVKELWVAETDDQGKHLKLSIGAAAPIQVRIDSSEVAILGMELAPLSLEKKRFLELGICGSFLRIKTVFGSRKFCRKHFQKNEQLGRLLSKLDYFRRMLSQ